ncbi:MAG TPA: HisA/HisF-related TIM barrel protein [Gemmatimonadales bacterium]|nr:HisA/HisF-related TIM barrel protein [Gemmatimonadales bacterium]
MDLYPAIDVQGGRLARAPTGTPADPAARARDFARAGARWLHVVDLDRAMGRGANTRIMTALLTTPGVRVQLGGALTDPAAIFAGLAAGAARVVLGPRGALDQALVAELLARHGADKIAVGIDVRDGRVADRASGAVFDATPAELAARLAAAGVRTVVYADAARDGALAGPDVDGARAIAALGLDVIVSGGVASLDDLRRARQAGLAGAVVGRALLENRFTLSEALACAG